ncbi:MAG: hypothetical protein AAGA68_13270 [Pseudomonadota bacterium]
MRLPHICPLVAAGLAATAAGCISIHSADLDIPTRGPEAEVTLAVVAERDANTAADWPNVSVEATLSYTAFRTWPEPADRTVELQFVRPEAGGRRGLFVMNADDRRVSDTCLRHVSAEVTTRSSGIFTIPQRTTVTTDVSLPEQEVDNPRFAGTPQTLVLAMTGAISAPDWIDHRLSGFYSYAVSTDSDYTLTMTVPCPFPQDTPITLAATVDVAACPPRDPIADLNFCEALAIDVDVDRSGIQTARTVVLPAGTTFLDLPIEIPTRREVYDRTFWDDNAHLITSLRATMLHRDQLVEEDIVICPIDAGTRVLPDFCPLYTPPAVDSFECRPIQCGVQTLPPPPES